MRRTRPQKRKAGRRREQCTKFGPGFTRSHSEIWCETKRRRARRRAIGRSRSRVAAGGAAGPASARVAPPDSRLSKRLESHVSRIGIADRAITRPAAPAYGVALDGRARGAAVTKGDAINSPAAISTRRPNRRKCRPFIGLPSLITATPIPRSIRISSSTT